MPRGQPDYGINTQTPVASGISDPGEAAARLGSINVYDRRGWTVWMDDFETPVLSWNVDSSVGGTDPILSTDRAWMGTQSVYFVTAAVAGEGAWINRALPLIRLGKIGFEFRLSFRTLAPSYFQFRPLIYDGSNISIAELRLEFIARTATIVSPAGNIVVAYNLPCQGTGEDWVPVKLVVNTDTDTYTRLLVGEQEIDLSAHSLVLGVPTAFKRLWTTLQLVGDVTAPAWAYVDSFILTQNEP